MISEVDNKSTIIKNLIDYPTAIEKFNLTKQSGSKIAQVEPHIIEAKLPVRETGRKHWKDRKNDKLEKLAAKPDNSKRRA